MDEPEQTGEVDTSARRTRGWAEDGPRQHRMKLRLSEAERAVIDEAAARVGMQPSAWIGEMMLRYVRGELDPIPAGWRDVTTTLLRRRAELARVASLTRQVQGHAQALGQLEDDSARVVALAERQLDRLDGVLAEAGRRAGRHS